jgi:hypothetical protein
MISEQLTEKDEEESSHILGIAMALPGGTE